MQLNNVKLINSDDSVNIAITAGIIDSITKNTDNVSSNSAIDFCNAVALPGLINSHDHLDFNCFPVLNTRTFNNYTEWGNHIHKEYKDDINAVLNIPAILREQWGVYKNLLAGVTTVVNHGDTLQLANPLITIFQDTQNLHSVKFQKHWKWHLNNIRIKDRPCVIHAGEGIDVQSHEEIDELIKWNLVNRKLVAVHAVAMDSKQSEKFAGIVWCPQSNKILLDRHANISELKKNTQLVFGTDSTLSSDWNIWEHIRLAASLNQVTDAELFNMMTINPATLWKMNKGALLPGKEADIVIVRNNDSKASWRTLYSTNPEDILLVLHKGKIRLIDESVLTNISDGLIHPAIFNPVIINGSVKFVEGNLPALSKAISAYYPAFSFPFQLAEPVY